ncbi:phage major capsid protein [Azospirillum sp. TSA2s]|uniref:phage major capsid protein n=1 Tax=Azospirillum sp. TSA2s TaxID=709810 RepID=UPI0010AAF109|nr:phage major capsid protein [Azospirillum sp. TSA2s]QCG93955.1 phage major capsid protein [Azospirillum sp. TSA2s]
MAKIHELAGQRAALAEKLSTLVADPAAYDDCKRQIDDVTSQITRMKEAEELQRSLAVPHGVSQAQAEDARADMVRGANIVEVGGTRLARTGWEFDDYVRHARRTSGFTGGENSFRSFGENLVAIRNAAEGARMGYQPDSRLVRASDDAIMTRAPSGANEMDPTSGGFLVQTDFATAIFMRAYDMGELLGRCQKLPIGGNSNGIKIPAIDETSRATGSRWGGVQSYWLNEAGAVSAAKPKFRLIELDLKKLMSLFYATDEMLQDTTALTSVANQAFSEEIMFMTEDSIFRGSGAGQPLGFLNSPAKVAVAKETGQSAGTIQYENVLKMWSRMWSRSRANSVWFINQDCESQLYAMAQVIGTAGVPVYLPANGISGQPYGTLFGRPVIPVEYADTLGTEGDITLVDLSQYVLADKNGVQAASSMHVAFLTNEMAFRFVYRVDGEPIWHAPLTPYKGSQTKSPFITLATR